MDEQQAFNSLDDWYTAGEAAKVLTQKSKRTVKPEYLRSLARLGKVRTKDIGGHAKLYLKADVDNYRVEARGRKVVRAQKARAKKDDRQSAVA
jgi:hypothetical protein